MRKHEMVMALTKASISRDQRGTANALRVLWLSPLMRPLARVQAEALRERGVGVLLVTTEKHPESDRAREYELVLDPGFRTASTWSAALAAQRRIREHRPDIVIAEQVRDPLWIALAGRVPRIQLVHDERRDDGRQRRVYARAVLDRWGARSAATVTYSNYAAIAVAARRDVAGTPVHVVPLCSDLDSTLVPPFVGHDGRRDFVMAGRLDAHKNIDIVLEAWQRHVDGKSWRGDELLLIGDGPLSHPDPAGLRSVASRQLPLCGCRHHAGGCEGFGRPLLQCLAERRAGAVDAAGCYADRFPGRGPARIPAGELSPGRGRRRCRTDRRV